MSDPAPLDTFAPFRLDDDPAYEVRPRGEVFELYDRGAFVGTIVLPDHAARLAQAGTNMAAGYRAFLSNLSMLDNIRAEGKRGFAEARAELAALSEKNAADLEALRLDVVAKAREEYGRGFRESDESAQRIMDRLRALLATEKRRSACLKGIVTRMKRSAERKEVRRGRTA